MKTFRLNALGKILLVCSLLSACTPLGPNPQKSMAMAMAASTNSLWRQQEFTPSKQTLAIVEAELAVRKQSRSASSYLGKRSLNGTHKIRFDRADNARVGKDDKNCVDFPSAAHAQRYFLAAGGPAIDPNDLDRDADGLACEWGVHIYKIARQNRGG